MRNLFIINGTDYIRATSEEVAKDVYVTDVMDEAVSAELIPGDSPVYIQRQSEGGEEIWGLKLHNGWELLEQHMVSDFFSGYYGDHDMIVYSTEW